MFAAFFYVMMRFGCGPTWSTCMRLCSLETATWAYIAEALIMVCEK